MRRANFRFAVLLGVVGLTAPVVALAAPVNDNFGHATAISALPFRGHSDTTSATVQAGEPKPSCDDSALKRSVWWRFKATAAAHLLAFDDDYQVLAVYRGTKLGSLSRLGCDINGGNVTFDAAAGDTIYFQVGPDSAGNGAPVTLHVKRQS
jgi:hypothetical protein